MYDSINYGSLLKGECLMDLLMEISEVAETFRMNSKRDLPWGPDTHCNTNVETLNFKDKSLLPLQYSGM